MLEPPAIPPDSILSTVYAAYGLPMTQVTFLPLGADLDTAVYRVDAPGAAYFCKLRRGDFSELPVTLLKYLSDQGIAEIIAPLVTQAGGLWAEPDSLYPYRLILYPFVEGKSGFEVELSLRNWADFGAAMRRIHVTPLPQNLGSQIAVEDFSPYWRDRVRAIFRQIDSQTLTDPIAHKLVGYLNEKRAPIFDLLNHAERLAEILARRKHDFVLCHADIHPGNLFIDNTGRLYIVDWDYPALAPRERDLMFIGGGQGYVNVTDAEEEIRFFQSYGAVEIDPVAMAYYRCERNIVEIGVECPRVFSPEVGDQNRQLSYDIVTWLFLPGSSVEMAYKSLNRLDDKSALWEVPWL